MAQIQCPACGKGRLVEGSIRSTGTVHFRPFSARFFALRTAEVKVFAHMCNACGVVTLIGDTKKLQSVQLAQTQEY